MAHDTEGLIYRLADRLEPVRPLARPAVRMAMWLAISVPYVVIVTVAMSSRLHASIRPLGARFLIEQFAALATGVTAAGAAFASVVPGSDRRLVLLPVLLLTLWLGSVGQGCVGDWIQQGSNGLVVRPDWPCVFGIIMVGAVPAIAMAIMLRCGARLTPHLTTALGGLAAAGLGDFGLRFVHQDASVMVLTWQLGSVFGLSAATSLAGPLLLKRNVSLKRDVMFRRA